MQVNGSFNHKVAQATGGCCSDSSHLLLGKFSFGERDWGQWDGFGVHGDGGKDLGLVLTFCPKLCSGHRLFLTHLVAMSPVKEKMRLRGQRWGFRSFESWLGLVFPFIEEIRKQPKSRPRSGGVQWAELYGRAGGSMDPL